MLSDRPRRQHQTRSTGQEAQRIWTIWSFSRGRNAKGRPFASFTLCVLPIFYLRVSYQVFTILWLENCKKFSVWGFTTTTRSGFDFRKTHFHSRRAGALPSCANVCKCPKTDFLRGASGSTSHTTQHDHGHQHAINPQIIASSVPTITPSPSVVCPVSSPQSVLLPDLSDSFVGFVAILKLNSLN
jgi:hypothetical protein